MRAAVVRAFDAPPKYDELETPAPVGEHQALVDVIAAGLHPRVRSQADGSHYTSTAELPLVPGIDGVGRLANGRLVYFILPDTTIGSMAEQTVIDLRRSIPLPDGVDPVALAAGMNPAMSAWVALRRRVRFEAGQSVLVLGATGSAGRMAVQVARHFGASRVIGAGRDPALLELLPGLGADEVVSLAGDAKTVASRLAQAASEVDFVIDYVWGKPAEDAIMPLLTARSDRSRPMTWIQIGAIAGPNIALPSVALRSANFQILGSGQGSVTTAGFLAELPGLAEKLAAGSFAISAAVAPLSTVEKAWTAPSPAGQRVVIVPSL